MIVDEKVILEFKAVENLSLVHKAQAVNYSRATGLQLAIIINFGRNSLQHERVVNYRPKNL
jgi:GxxExxY protein